MTRSIPTEIRERPLAAAALLIGAAHVAAALLFGASPVGAAASNLLQVAIAFVAGLQCLTVSRRATFMARRFWTLTGAAFWIWSAGQALYTYHETWLGMSVPRPSWSHFLFRLYGAPLLMALLLGSEEDEGERDRRGPNWPQILDFAQVGILFLFFYFDLYFVSGGPWHGLTDLAMLGFLELSDVENWGLAAAFVLRARLSRNDEARKLSGRLVPYLLCYAAGSSFYNYAYSFWHPRTGEWPDLVFTLSLAVGSLSAGAWRPGGSPRAARPGSGLVVNWTPATLPLLTLALAMPLARTEPGAAFVAVFAAVVCFGARLVIMQYRRERLLEALRASEARYANLLRLAPDAIFVHVGGRVTFANPATARLLGVASPDELLGRDTVEFAPPEHHEELKTREGRLAGEAGLTRLSVVRRDGARVPIEAVAMSFDQAPGTPGPPPRLVIARDVTDRVRAEAEREALIRELEAKNAELERFTYTVSHDLKGPLITVAGFLDHVHAAAERGDTASMRTDLERIRGAARKMDRLLNDLLDLSRLGHVTGIPQPVSFASICQEAVDLLHGRFAARGIALAIAPDLPVVQADRTRLLEVAQNLLENAAKFMGDQKDPRIEIGWRKDGEETVLFVRDNGLGIEPRYQGRVFGLFDKLDARAEGTGVGLAIVKRIIELHGGRIWVESEGALKGASFCFTLPLA